MSNLVPEKRANKNGVLVTKHVKPVGEAKGSKSSLPAPSLSGAVSKPLKAPSAATIVKTLNKREEELYGPTGGNGVVFSYQSSHVDKYPPELRKEINDFIATAGRSDWDEMRTLLKSSYDDPNRIRAYMNTISDLRWIDENRVGIKPNQSGRDNCGEEFRSVYDELYIDKNGKEIGEYHFGVIKAERLAAVMNISSSLFLTTHERYREIEAIRENFDFISPALPVIMAAKKERERAFSEKLKDPKLPQSERVYKPMMAADMVEIAEYTNQYPDKVDFIADTIKERGEFNREMIDIMLGTEASAIASGIL